MLPWLSRVGPDLSSACSQHKQEHRGLQVSTAYGAAGPKLYVCVREKASTLRQFEKTDRAKAGIARRSLGGPSPMWVLREAAERP